MQPKDEGFKERHSPLPGHPSKRGFPLRCECCLAHRPNSPAVAGQERLLRDRALRGAVITVNQLLTQTCWGSSPYLWGPVILRSPPSFSLSQDLRHVPKTPHWSPLGKFVHSYVVCPSIHPPTYPSPPSIHPSTHLSIHPSTYSLSVYSSTHASIHRFVCSSIQLPACPPVCLPIHPSIHPSRHPSIYPSIYLYPSIRIPICTSICLPVYLPVCSSIHPPTHCPSTHPSIHPSV